MPAEKKPDVARKIAPGVLQPFSVAAEPVLTLRSRRRLGDVPSAGVDDNHVSDARLALGRLLHLWAITVDDYNQTMSIWQPMAPDDRLYGDNLTPLVKAIRKVVEPRLANEVANTYLPVHLPPGGTVGLKGTVAGDDLVSVQRALSALSFVKSPDLVRSGDWGSTLLAIRDFKKGMAAATVGWTAIHADEDDFGGDRFGGRTYGPFPGMTGGETFSAFIPKGAPLDSNFVHVHFSAGDVTGETGFNAVLMHGLRGAFFESKWIVIGVRAGMIEAPNDPKEDDPKEDDHKKVVNFISTAHIEMILGKIGRSRTSIDGITLSAHSRGANALIYTLGGSPVAGVTGTGKPSIDAGKVAQVTVFDHTAAEVGTAVRAAGLQGKARIYLATEDGNPTGLPVVELRSPQISDRLLAKDCFRAIAYVRFMQDAIRRGILSPPQDRMDLANLLLNGSPPLPDRGKFTSQSLPAFCAAHAAAQSNMQKILDKDTGLRAYVYKEDLPHTRQKFDESVDRHHFFVSEVVHELVLS